MADALLTVPQITRFVTITTIQALWQIKTSDNKATMQELMAQWRMRMASSLNLESESQISVEELLSCSYSGYYCASGDPGKATSEAFREKERSLSSSEDLLRRIRERGFEAYPYTSPHYPVAITRVEFPELSWNGCPPIVFAKGDLSLLDELRWPELWRWNDLRVNYTEEELDMLSEDEQQEELERKMELILMEPEKRKLVLLYVPDDVVLVPFMLPSDTQVRVLLLDLMIDLPELLELALEADIPCVALVPDLLDPYYDEWVEPIVEVGGLVISANPFIEASTELLFELTDQLCHS